MQNRQSNYFWKYLFNDRSTWALIFANILTISFSLLENWDLLTILRIYWCQSVIIGVFNFIRIWILEKHSIKDLKSAKDSKAFFFAFHYGFFHLIYAAFLFLDSPLELPNTTSFNIYYVLFIVAVFFFNHLFSFLHNRKKYEKKQSIDRLFLFPYARIIPMHLTILFGGILIMVSGETGSKAAIIFFLILKTVADVIMHVLEHTGFLKKRLLN